MAVSYAAPTMEPRAIQSCLRAGIVDRAERIGPFLALFNRNSGNPFRNYAVPDDRAEPTAAEVADLVGAFHRLDRLPRLEYVRPAPAVDAALTAAGFDVRPTLGLMALESFADTTDPDGYAIVVAPDDSRFGAAVRAQNTAYGEPDTEPDPTGLARTVAGGGGVVIAVHTADDTVVGAGLFTPPRDGLTEIAAIGVLPEHRRRGVASAITARLTAEALRRGADPFLQVEHDEPRRIYEKIGYRTIGELADARLNR